MKVAWQTEFYCDICNRNITGRVNSDDELPEEQKPYALEQLQHQHRQATHITCSRSGSHIKPHEISPETIEWSDNYGWRNLCADCGG